MCFCDKPTVNGTAPVKTCFEYPASNYQPNPPALLDGDVLLFDEPGRCGGLDSHSHHFRLVKNSSSRYLLTRHGGGDDRIRLFPHRDLTKFLEAMDSNTRYWMLATIHSAHHDGAHDARETEASRWKEAAAEKRIKTRKMASRGVVKVWIEPKEAEARREDQ